MRIKRIRLVVTSPTSATARYLKNMRFYYWNNGKWDEYSRNGANFNVTTNTGVVDKAFLTGNNAHSLVASDSNWEYMDITFTNSLATLHSLKVETKSSTLSQPTTMVEIYDESDVLLEKKLLITSNTSGSDAITNFVSTRTTRVFSTATAYIETTNDNSLKDVSAIEKVTIDYAQPPGTNLRVLCSFDGKQTWKAWDGNAWNTITKTSIMAGGMTPQILHNITPNQWGSGIGTVNGIQFDILCGMVATQTLTPVLRSISVDYSTV